MFPYKMLFNGTHVLLDAGSSSFCEGCHARSCACRVNHVLTPCPTGHVVQILQLSQHDNAITIYYHPNSFSSTQSIRSNLASCWRFTVALDSAEVPPTPCCAIPAVHSLLAL